MNQASRKLAAQKPAATQPGPDRPKLSAVKPPTAGPKMKPSPNAMPIKAMPADRFSGG